MSKAGVVATVAYDWRFRSWQVKVVSTSQDGWENESRLSWLSTAAIRALYVELGKALSEFDDAKAAREQPK